MKALSDFHEFERFLGRFTNYERVVNFRYDKKTLGPERMRSLTAALGMPQDSYPSCHIAGTKGKGSTCLMLEALLTANLYLTGAYMSPHVEHLTERIRIGGSSVSRLDLVRDFNTFLPYLETSLTGEPDSFPTFFELMTALAMQCFRTHEVDWAIFEVGLGGRLDATNILQPRWTAITSIGLEHTKQLGGTLKDIAREKAGIIKRETPVVLGPLPEEAGEEIRRVAAEHSAPITDVGRDMVRAVGSGGLSIEGVQEIVPAGPIRGPALRTDFGIAFSLFRLILEDRGQSPSAAVIQKGLEALRLPARAELFPIDPPAIIDGAHTEESMHALRLTLEEIEFPRPRTLVFSLANDKQVPAILEEVRLMADDLILTCSDSIRSVSPAALQRELGSGDIVEDPDEAFEEALRRGQPVVVTGSFYLAGRIRQLVRQLPRQG